MRLLNLLPLLPLAAAQDAGTAASTDAATGIAFQTYSADSGVKFGIALPPAGGTDFIGQLVRLLPPLPPQTVN